MRRATLWVWTGGLSYDNFYPRSPCGERQANAVDQILPGHISIHALLAESDPDNGRIRNAENLTFLSTLSLRRATGCQQPCGRPTTDFYPRSPCGERLLTNVVSSAGTTDFYPRSPCGERQAIYPCVTPPKEYFYPRSPCGERLVREPTAAWDDKFLSTLSLRRATLKTPCVMLSIEVFLSTLSLRRATPMQKGQVYYIKFLSTLSLRRATLGGNDYEY